MIYPQLVNYVKNSLAKNIPLAQIKKSLIERGWRESDINEAIALINQPAEKKLVNSKMPMKNKMPAKKISPTLLFGIIGGAVLILIIGIIIYLLLTTTPTLSDDEILQGASITLGEKKAVKFNINDEEQNLVVNTIGVGSASVTFGTTSTTLSAGQEEKFDLNSDNTYDLLIRLENIINGEANFYIQGISEAICTEDWECTNWTTCINEIQNRTCTDSNDCGTEESKPAETQECIVEVVLSCAEQNGTECEIYEECDEALVGNCCLGNCVRIPVIECGTNMTCLIDNTEICHPANATYSFSSSDSNWTQTAGYYYLIEGFDDETKEECNFYTEIKNVTGNFTSSYWTTLQGEGLTDEQINTLRESVISSLTGISGSCKFPVSELEDYVTKIEEENYVLSDVEITEFECAGSIYS